tara:strand:- start:8 stop:415 length:408 start_codon:yes stop_codon:yes gene_type:complete
MPDGGRISFSSWNKDGVAFVRVSDSDKGMAEDVKKRIFDPFFTTQRPRGTGLGLSIVHSIISRHNGSIEVNNKIRRDSTFTLQLPIVIRADIISEIFKTEQVSKSMVYTSLWLMMSQYAKFWRNSFQEKVTWSGL